MSVAEAIEAELDALGGRELGAFDVHSHTGADVDGSARTCEEQVRDIAAVGGRSVIFPLCVERGYEVENRRVLEEAARNPGVLVPFARIDPRVSGRAETAEALAAGARGVKLHPRGEDFRLEHPNVDGIFAAAAEAEAPVLIHAGGGVGSFGTVITDLARRHRRAPLVLAHAGISDLSWIWRELPDHPNVYFDTAWWNPADLRALFALVPPGRILFGTDAPYMDVGLGLVFTLRSARHAGLCDDAIRLIMGGQLEALLSGEAPIDGGPAPGPRAAPAQPIEERVMALLAAAGGCMLGGGDPSNLLGLAAAATEAGSGGAGRDLDPRIAGLVDEAGAGGDEPILALALGLVLAATPGVGSRALIA